jgi:DNA-directed RNA polymerase beta' subunit
MACVGLIKLDGKFIPQRIAQFRHTVFHKQFTGEPTAFGYIPESYQQGITHKSMFNGASAARQNVLTKGLVTGEAGAQGRNIIKAIESINITNNQFSARNNGTEIVEFTPGDDGFESCLAYNNDYSIIQKPDEEIVPTYDNY